MRDWWNRLKCWAWKRHTTIKPRYLDHEWCDRIELMPHMMFEILCRFVEEECSPDEDWYGECGRKIGDKYVMDEMKDLIAWWHVVYNKEYQEVSDMIWKEAERHLPTHEFTLVEDEAISITLYTMEKHFNNEEDEAIYRRCMDAQNKLHQNMLAALDSRLYRIIPLITYMWT